MKPLLVLFAILFLSACTSTATFNQSQYEEYADVTFYRTGQLQGSVADTYIGWNGRYFHSLSSGEKMTTKVPAGLIELNVKANVDLANELSIDLKANQHYCVKVEANPDNIVLVNWFVPSYQLKRMACPSTPDANSRKSH